MTSFNSEYQRYRNTSDVTCDNPANGYSSLNGLLALRCDIKNNGYSPATIVPRTNVSNDSWMAPVFQLRIVAAMNQMTTTTASSFKV